MTGSTAEVGLAEKRLFQGFIRQIPEVGVTVGVRVEL